MRTLINIFVVCLMLASVSFTSAATTTSITQFGITWTFAQPVEFGQFANGDYWVVGPVTITDITPKCIESAGHYLNGSMVNPVPESQEQAFDSRPCVAYTHSLNVAYGITAANPLILQPHTSLLSSISLDEPVGVAYIDTVAILTVLPVAAPAGSFRPAYCMVDKTIPHNVSELDYAKLLSLEPQGGPPALSTVERMFERPWIEYVADWTSRCIHPEQNMPDYGREIGANVSQAAMSLHLNYTNTQKETLLIRFVQVGIDFYGIVQAGGTNVWPANGGHMHSRKWPIVFAGLVLNDTGMQNVQATFQEDEQTYFGKSWHDATALWRIFPGIPYLQDEDHPSEWVVDGRGLPGDPPAGSNSHWRSESYRNCCTSYTWVGQALAARLMQVEQTWNHWPYFEYVDRWMEQDWEPWAVIIDQQTGMTAPRFQGSSNPGWIGAMWDAYRGTIVYPVSIEPAGGDYENFVVVTLTTDTDPGTIRYTLDDSDPNEHSPEYTGPFELASSATVTARCFSDGVSPSRATTAVYNITKTAVRRTYVFYNNSFYDGYDPAANVADDDAIAADKSLAILGDQSTFTNYTSYSRGINGLILDVANLTAAPSVADFEFTVGNDDDFDGWTMAAAPASIVVRSGVGIEGTDRLTITWADGAIVNTWLCVKVLPSLSGDLVDPVYLFIGNTVGDTGDDPDNAIVDATDEIACRNNPRTFARPADITSPYDHDRDRKVDATDQIIARNHASDFISALKLLSIHNAPTTDAGDDIEITLPAAAVLSGAASDDGYPDPPAELTVTWEKLTGPGDVTFDDQNSLDTAATFSSDGVYELTLTADDGDKQAVDTIVVTVHPELVFQGMVFDLAAAYNYDAIATQIEADNRTSGLNIVETYGDHGPWVHNRTYVKSENNRDGMPVDGVVKTVWGEYHLSTIFNEPVPVAGSNAPNSIRIYRAPGGSTPGTETLDIDFGPAQQGMYESINFLGVGNSTDTSNTLAMLTIEARYSDASSEVIFTSATNSAGNRIALPHGQAAVGAALGYPSAYAMTAWCQNNSGGQVLFSNLTSDSVNIWEIGGPTGLTVDSSKTLVGITLKLEREGAYPQGTSAVIFAISAK